MKINVFAGILLTASFGLVAQTGSSSISGSVKDPSGAPIPLIKVKVVNAESGSSREAITNDAGIYSAGALLPGSYQIEGDIAGFDHLVRGPVTLLVSQSIVVDLVMQIGQQTQTVQITEAAPLTESQSSSIGQAVSRRMLSGLPLPNRAASSLAALAPGVVMIDPGTGTAENYPIFSVAGGRARNQNFTLDGGNVSNAVGLTRPQQLTSLPVDAMQEFRVITNNYAAEFGHSTGGIVTMSTRAGTNEDHGSLFESLQNNVLNARNFFAASRPAIRLNQFGATFGGPIRRDKTHFFATWEQTRQLTSQTLAATVPTLLQRDGNFSDLRSTLYDPTTGTGTARLPFPGNRIPVARLDTVAVAAVQYFPLPNRAGTITNANNFSGSSADTLTRNIVVGRVDHQFRPTDLATVRYYINDSATSASGTYGIPVADPNGDATDVRVQSLLAAETHVFSPTLTNDLRVTYLRRKFIDSRPGAADNLAAKIGLKGVSGSAFPAFSLSGYGIPNSQVIGSATSALGNSTAVTRIQTPILDRQILDALAWQHGRHSFKFGGELRFGANDEIRDRSSAGSFTFSPLITGFNNSGGNSLATFLLGQVNAASIQVSDRIRTRAAYTAFYVQDDWRITDRLTLNAGLRWEAEFPRREVDNHMNSFDSTAINPVSGTPGVVTFAGVNGVPERAFRTDYNNFGPRVGLAWRTPQDFVIRGGGGFFYGPTVSDTIGDVASLGYSTAASYTTSQAASQSVFRLQDGFPAYTRPALTAAFGAVTPGQSPHTSVSFFNPSQMAPISYQYNLNIQKELAGGTLVEIGYIGNVSHHLTANDLSLNQVPIQVAGAANGGNTQALRPFPQFSNVTWINPSIGNSTYNGVFVRGEKRFSKGVSFLAHYTFSKFLDDVESANEYGSTGSYMDAYNRRLDRGLSGSDVPHHIVVTLLYELPSVRGNSVIRGVFGGWKVGALQTWESGPAFTVITNANTTNAFPAGSLRPDLPRNPSLSSSERGAGRWFDTTAFANPASFTFGNSPRSGLRGAPIVTTDVTLEKTFSLTERIKLDVRSEFYNLFNHTIFNTPGATFGAADFGVVSSARAPRTTQLAARMTF
jgi:hypothetical protein